MGVLPYVVDILIVLVFVSAIIYGYNRGFVKMILSIAAILLSLLIAGAFSAPLAQWASEKFVAEKVSGYVDGYIDGVIEETGLSSGDASGGYFDGAQQKITEVLPKELASLLKSYDISVDDIFEKVSPEDTLREVGEKITVKIQGSVVLPVLKVITFIILFLGSSLVFRLIIAIVCLVTKKLPVIKKLNKVLGAVLGAVRGVSVVAVLCIFLVLMTKLFPDNALSAAVSQATLTNFINDFALGFIY